MFTAHNDRGIVTVRYDHGEIEERKSKLPLIIVIIISFVLSVVIMGYYDRAVQEMNQDTRAHYEAVKSTL